MPDEPTPADEPAVEPGMSDEPEPARRPSLFRRIFGARRRLVTDEHLPIDAELLGADLATPARRGAAIFLDMFLCSFLIVPWILFWGLLALHLNAPKVLPGAWSLVTDLEADSDAVEMEIWRGLVEMVAKRRPDLIPPEGHEALATGDYAQARKILTVDTPINFQLGDGGRSYYDRQRNTYFLTGEILFGSASRVFGGLSGLMLYFSVLTWRGGGRTPGKWFWGIAVRRLDGKKLSIWDAFGRAGGYSASLSTAGLGFFDALWHPNRQTIHDRIVGTVVVRLAGQSFWERARNLVFKVFERHAKRSPPTAAAEAPTDEVGTQTEEICDEPNDNDAQTERTES